MADREQILLDCPFCRGRVGAVVVGEVKYDNWFDPSFVVKLAHCLVCKRPLVGYEAESQRDETLVPPFIIYASPIRIWPEPETDLAAAIPPAIAGSLQEARSCLMCGTYTASVAMSGRALEAIGRHFHTQGKADRLMLAEGLDELRDSEIIDKRLYEWGKELKLHRNVAAHASGQDFDREDAQDLYDFVTAICEYVFVLTAKFNAFQERQAQKQKPIKSE